jgi:hypothetical protein
MSTSQAWRWAVGLVSRYVNTPAGTETAAEGGAEAFQAFEMEQDKAHAKIEHRPSFFLHSSITPPALHDANFWVAFSLQPH